MHFVGNVVGHTEEVTHPITIVVVGTIENGDIGTEFLDEIGVRFVLVGKRGIFGVIVARFKVDWLIGRGPSGQALLAKTNGNKETEEERADGSEG